MIVKPKTITAKDKAKMNKNGIIVIEHPLPSEVRIVQQTDGVSGDMILMSAMKAIQSSFPKDKFAEELFRRMQESESKS